MARVTCGFALALGGRALHFAVLLGIAGNISEMNFWAARERSWILCGSLHVGSQVHDSPVASRSPPEASWTPGPLLLSCLLGFSYDLWWCWQAVPKGSTARMKTGGTRPGAQAMEAATVSRLCQTCL